MAVRSEGVSHPSTSKSMDAKSIAALNGTDKDGSTKRKSDSKTKTSSSDSSGADRPGRFDGNFFSESVEELKKISTPSRQETFQATLVTILMVVFMALCVFLVDLLFNGIMSAFLNKN